MDHDNPLNAPRPSAPADDNPFGSAQPMSADLDYLLTPEPEASIGPIDVIGRTLHLLLTRPLALLGLIVASSAVFWTLTFVLTEMSSPITSLMTELGLRKLAVGFQAVFVGVLSWAASTIVQAPIVGAAIEAQTGRRDLLRSFFQRGVRHLPAVLGSVAAVVAISIAVLATALGAEALLIKLGGALPQGDFAFMLVVGAGSLVIGYLALRTLLGFSLVAPIVLVEELGAKAAVIRSWRLTAGNRYAIGFGILLPLLGLSIATVVVGSVAPTVAPWFNLSANLFLVLYATAMAPAAYVAFREFIDGVAPSKLLVKPGA